MKVYFGPQMPTVNKIQLVSTTDDGEIKIDADLSYNGEFHLTLKIFFNIGIPKLGKNLKFPAVLAVTVTQIAGKMQLYFAPPPSTRLWYGFYAEPDVSLSINTEIGGKSKLRNLPKLANIIVYAIKSEIISLMVLPHMDDIPLPGIHADHEDTKPTDSPEDSTSSLSSPSLNQEVDEQVEKILSNDFRKSKDKLV